MTKEVILSDEQKAVAQHILDDAGNLIVEALAGTGKTFTCIQVIPLMRGSVAYLVFAKKNAREAQAKFAAAGIRADAGTFHSFGSKAIRAYAKNARMEGKKGNGVAGYYKADRIFEELKVPEYLQAFVEKAASLGMQTGFGIAGFTKIGDLDAWLALVEHYNIDDALGEDNLGVSLKGRAECIKDGCRFAAKFIVRSTELIHEVYSFADMLYMPLRLNMKLPQYDNVVVDEAQDSNMLRLEFARRMHKEG